MAALIRCVAALIGSARPHETRLNRSVFILPQKPPDYLDAEADAKENTKAVRYETRDFDGATGNEWWGRVRDQEEEEVMQEGRKWNEVQEEEDNLNTRNELWGKAEWGGVREKDEERKTDM